LSKKQKTTKQVVVVGLPIKKRLGKMGLGEMGLGEMRLFYALRLGEIRPNQPTSTWVTLCEQQSI